MAKWGAGRVSAGGVSLEYVCWGPPPDRAPTIALLHEGLGCVALWRDFPERLSEATACGVLAWSRAGYGQSGATPLPRPLDYMTREAAGPVAEVLDALAVRNALLLGHSDGATIAAEYAGRIRDPRVRGLVLMAPHFFTEPMGLAEIAAAGEAFRTTNLPERMAKYHADPQATFQGWNDAWLASGFRDWNVASVLDEIRVPILALQGRQDQYGTLAQIEVVAHRAAGPVDTVVLDECRHSPHFDQPDLVLARVTSFARSLFQ